DQSRIVPPGAGRRSSTSSGEATAASASSSTKTTKPPNEAGPHTGVSAAGSGDVQSVTGCCRFTASERASRVPVTRSFVAAAIAFVRWNSMKPGTPRPRTIPATAIAIISSHSVNPYERESPSIERDYIVPRPYVECPPDDRVPGGDERHEHACRAPSRQAGHVRGLPGPTRATRGRPV